jgi:GntR family transcriptional repressor for pyruvate dehydrogenase complex
MSHSVSPIERRKVYELIAEHLQGQIVGRKLRPGDLLPTERELSESYHVGRSSVREALRMLESRGLIKTSNSAAFSVAEYGNPLNQSLRLLLAVDEANLLELFEVRKILEVEVAGLAAMRRSEEDLVGMAAATDDMEAGLSSQERYISADLRFHVGMAQASRNRIALHMMHAIRDPLHRALASIYHIAGSPQRSIMQHRAILAAVSAGDAQAAREQMREHLLRVEGDIRDALTEAPRTQI